MAEKLPVAIVSPTAQTLSFDGVEARIWNAVTESGAPFHLAVHRVAVDLEHDAAVLSAFPILAERKTPEKITEPSAATWRGPCLTRLREALRTAQNDLCRHVAHSDDESPDLHRALAALEIACDEAGGLPPCGVDETGFATAEILKPWPCPCSTCGGRAS